MANRLTSDASTVPADPDGKQRHVVEILNVVDMGTSIVLAAHADFHAQTALEAMAQILQEHGIPVAITFDRDTRWVGSASGRDFPSAFVRFLVCLGIPPIVCPPHRPDRNDLVAYCTPCAWLACGLIFVNIFLRSVLIGRVKDSNPMIIGPIQRNQTCPSPVHEGLSAHSRLALAASSALNRPRWRNRAP